MSELLRQMEAEDGIVWLELNREDAANALSAALLDEMIRTFETLKHRKDVRVVVITGHGRKAFCAGADLKERRGMDADGVRLAVARIRRAVEGLASLPMPVIAAVNGVAFGGGTELALAADLRVLSADAKLGLTETSLAIIPGAGGTQRLPRIIGVAKAKELIFTARRIGADEAQQLGLANAVVPADSLVNYTTTLAREIAKNGPVAVRQAKLAIDAGLSVDLQTGLKVEGMAYEGVIGTVDRVEALEAFAEKRPPVFRGE